ncbi:P-loop containing nucleoside triphosphate hydrolase protein [Athelia psychrophila]|uniref:P-loop containing nucleoside triphosphate hydrolase protein n=1 Tax=Athelia psychrophila TaxID=1759441 RepID=A0A166E7X6_9AGAM|nr:P-loop containing nucleoside triphosphate hydrolase protein [Fibularhizoctonia sp. CBS 109695]
MDLENFEIADVSNQPVQSAHAKYTTAEALRHLDEVWYTQASRRARWINIIGDFAGSERFIIDGESLLQLVLDDHLLAIGRSDDPSFQTLHAFHSLERILGDFSSRSAVYDVVFWNDNRHLTIKTGHPDQYLVASRSLARCLLFQHLSKLDLPVYTFQDISDPAWIDYQDRTKPIFVMLNDGGLRGQKSDLLSENRVLSQRMFMFNLLASGIEVSTLAGVEFHDCKIFSFVFESQVDATTANFATHNFKLALVSAEEALQAEERKHRRSAAGLVLAKNTNKWLHPRDHELATAAKIYLVSEPIEMVSKPLLFLFLAHCLVLETVSVQERALHLATIDSTLRSSIINNFLPAVFLAFEYMVRSSSAAFNIDGRLFITLVDFCIRNNAQSTKELFGAPISARLATIWSDLDLENQDFRTLIDNSHPVQETTATTSTIVEPVSLLSFNNSVFDEALSIIKVNVLDRNNNTGDSAPKFDFGQGILFADTPHWHTSKAILPRHQGGEDSKPVDEKHRRRLLRGEQRFMANLQRQAGTLTGALGASLQQIVIPLVGSKGSKAKMKGHGEVVRVTKPEKAEKLSSADKLRKKIQEQKQSTRDESTQSWWGEQMTVMKKMAPAAKQGHLDALVRNKRSEEPAFAVEMHLYRLNFELQAWILEAEPQSPAVRDKYTLYAMRAIKAILDRQTITPTVLKVISTVLVALGFEDHIHFLQEQCSSTMQEDRPLSFDFMKLVKSKTKAPIHEFMHITEDPAVWQLRLFGEFMDRSMDSQADRRVEFHPDAWQRDALDCIDDECSLLVVAPTSAGKTIISYYAMEKVLRNSDDDILVYVAPTKALVTQIAAEVYGRFRKDLKEGSCWAIHTRDYRIHNPQKCQILVTVPEMLAIMLLSPPLARVWTPRIKRIILDEIHSIGQQEGGAVWEQIILLAPCPIIGLSATVGSPEIFNEWLRSVQEAHGYQHKFISHPHQYSHLRKFNYVLQKPANRQFLGLDSHQPTGRLRFLHPISMLSFGARDMLPDLSLEASDTLSLYEALSKCQDRISVDLRDLHPKKFFVGTSFLTQKDILRYEAALKAILIPLIASDDAKDPNTVLHSIIRHLEDPIMRDIPQESLNQIPARGVFRANLIHFLADLHANGDLPAILFSFDRSDCEVMANVLLLALTTAEADWRKSSPEWTRKLQNWERWKLRAKERERLADRTKQKNADDEAPGNAAALGGSWESSFDPNDPSPQFSFTSVKNFYSKTDLDADIARLPRMSCIQPWALECLRRGIAVHHTAMNKHYRSLVENLFRQGFVRVVIAHSTTYAELALGINAPTKTSVFCGYSPFLTGLMYRQCAGRAGRRGKDLLRKVVFYGLPMYRVQRLVLSKIPALGGNFPLTSTLCLRLFNLLNGSENAPVAVKAIQSLLNLPRVSFSSEVGKHQMLHHLRFNIEYLRRARLLDAEGRPLNLFGIAAHLFYQEPNNLALVALLRNGVLHKLCQKNSFIDCKRDFIILVAHLFGRKYLPREYSTDENINLIIKRSPSIVVLPPLPKVARDVLLAHDKEILQVFTGYVSMFVEQHADKLGVDTTLPLSRQELAGDPALSTPFHQHLRSVAIPVVARSAFVANSGHGEVYHSVSELVRTSRSGLHLNESVIPSMAHITATPGDQGSNNFALNAYLLDFYTHGQKQALAEANGIRLGDVWSLLQYFLLILRTIKSALEQLLLKAAQEATQAGQEVESAVELDNGYESFDPAEMDDDGDEGGTEFKRPKGVQDCDWKVYEVISGALKEFEEKFTAI